MKTLFLMILITFTGCATSRQSWVKGCAEGLRVIYWKQGYLLNKEHTFEYCEEMYIQRNIQINVSPTLQMAPNPGKD